MNLTAVYRNVTAGVRMIYFIRAGRTRTVKIGFAKDVEARLAALQTGSHHALHLIGYVPGEQQDEIDWHDQFRHLRIRGEWFRLALDLRMAINAALHEREGAVRYLSLSVLTA